MINYIKWELKDYFNKKAMFFIGIGIIFLLYTILSYDSVMFFSGLVYSAFFIIVFISLIFSFVIGTKRIINTFKKKTFLLESMIPLPVKKILLSKFLIGFIINLIYSFIGIIGVSIMIVKGTDVDIFDLYKNLLQNIDIYAFLRFCLLYIIAVLTFMSLVVFCYIIGKVIKPNGKGNMIISVIIWFVICYTVNYILGNIAYKFEYFDLVFDIIYLIITIITYYISVWLIENKLEIYK